jgi:hypothetical protein
MYRVRRNPKLIEPLAELAAQFRNSTLRDEEVGRVGSVVVSVEMCRILYELYFRMPFEAWPDLESAVLTDEFDNDWLPGERPAGMREH